MSDEPRIPRGRLRRLSKLVGLTTKVGTGLVTSRAKKLLGGEGDPKVEAARRVLETLGELKGAALKLGQTLSLGSDHLPPEVRKVVSRLFSQAPTLPYEQIAVVIEEELGGSPRALYATFDEVPFAGASLGQVHAARLHSGEQVAVKVQYPGVATALADDLNNAETVIRALGIGGSLLDGRDYFDELKREIGAELDYRRELLLLEQFRGYLARWPDLVVPRAYPALCAGRVLTLERLEGPTLHAFTQRTDTTAAERFAVGEKLARAIYGPFLFHRAIHGDAHPGNFVVLPDGRLGVLDFGSVKHLSEKFWRCYCEAFAAGLAGGHPDLPSLVRSGGFTLGIPDERAKPLLEEIARIVGKPLRGPYDFGSDDMVAQLIALKQQHMLDMVRIRPPPEAILFYRAIGGLSYNLRCLKASGDFRKFFEESMAELGRAA